jgi:hypothetical protein
VVEHAASRALFERASAVIPGGVNSPVRSFRSVGGSPYFVTRGEGAYVWDADGNRLLDFVQSYGASILGHADPRVVRAVAEAAERGTTFGAPTEGEVLLAEAICARVPGCEQVRLVSSGTEAAMSAVRVARGFTGRSRIVKFAGCYHGHSDGLLAGGGSGVATLGLPDSAGVPAGAVANGFPESVPAWYTGPSGASKASTSARPPNAPTGSPPPITFPKHQRSGRTPDQPDAPSSPSRNPVMTSSKINNAPTSSQAARRPSRNPTDGATSPMFAATASTMTHATRSSRSGTRL